MKLRLAFFAALAALAACAPTVHEAVAPAAPAAPAAPVVPAFATPPLSAASLMAHVRVLSSDEFGGRLPSTQGEELTLAYLEKVFTAEGLQPGVTAPDGTHTFRQAVPLVSQDVQGAPQLSIGGGRGAARAYAFGDQFVAWTKRVVDHVAVQNAPLVFVGYGVVAPERNWNDYAGVDMHGKVAVMLINDPDFESGEDHGFGGRAMTYYGRWTYKFAEAARQGAVGAIIIHETAPASYPWAVVQSSWSGEQFNTVLADRGMSRAQFEGWVTQAVGEEMLRRAGQNFATLKARAQHQGFRPVPLNINASLAFDITNHESVSYNMVGVLPGRAHPDQAVIYGAHWDHLGHCTPIDGDDICNGALDNATGVAGVIELARRAIADGPADRSMTFIAFTAEEQGLLGSEYYADNPTFAPANIAAMINMDGLSIYGPAHEMTVVGYGKSEMDDIFTRAAVAAGRRVTPDQFPERGSFFRSDQFNFARIGVPVLYTDAGTDLIDGGEARGRQLDEAYIENRYHKPQDEITPDWNMEGATLDLGLLYQVGRGIADSQTWPKWHAGAEFAATRAAQGR